MPDMTEEEIAAAAREALPETWTWVPSNDTRMLVAVAADLHPTGYWLPVAAITLLPLSDGRVGVSLAIRGHVPASSKATAQIELDGVTYSWPALILPAARTASELKRMIMVCVDSIARRASGLTWMSATP